MTVPCDDLTRLHDLLVPRGLLGACIANGYREVLAAMVSAPGEPRQPTVELALFEHVSDVAQDDGPVPLK